MKTLTITLGDELFEKVVRWSTQAGISTDEFVAGCVEDGVATVLQETRTATWKLKTLKGLLP